MLENHINFKSYTLKQVTKKAIKTLLISPIFVLSAITLTASPLSTAHAAPFDNVAITGTKTKSFSSYDAVYIAPIQLSLPQNGEKTLRRTRLGLSTNAGRRFRPISDRDRDRKANDLYGELSAALERNFELADSPGVGILTIKTTLTDLRSTRPTIADYSNQINLSANSLYTGGASIIIVLSEDGSEIANISDKFDTSFNDPRPRVGIWEDADRAFERWGRNLRKYISKN